MLYQDLLDNLSSQIQQRFSAVTKFEFFQLLSCDYYSSARSTFPVHLLNKLSKIYGSTFDYGLLKSELEVIYSQEDFRKACPWYLRLYLSELFDFCIQRSIQIGQAHPHNTKQYSFSRKKFFCFEKNKHLSALHPSTRKNERTEHTLCRKRTFTTAEAKADLLWWCHR